MNSLCYSPVFSLSQKLVRFQLKPKDAVAWLAAHRARCPKSYLRILANCPEALLFGLCSSREIAARPQLQLNETSLDALMALLESPQKPTVDSATKIYEINFGSSKRKAFTASLKKLNSNSEDNAQVDSFCADLAAELTGLLDGTEIAGTRLPTVSKDDWQTLAAAVCDQHSISFDLSDWLASENDYQQRLLKEKMAGLKQLAYGASHEINNPLANIASRAQTLIMDETDPERKLRLAKINQQAFRAHEMIADMMLFAHPPQLEHAEFDLVNTVREVLNELKPTAAEQGTKLVEAFPSDGDFVICADRTQVSVAIRAIVMNSLEALRESGQVSVAIVDLGEQVEVTVTDNGPGISEDAARHLFDPFYSGREAGRGLGFGLSKAWRIAELHGGQILADSPAEGGAQFHLRIPRLAK